MPTKPPKRTIPETIRRNSLSLRLLLFAGALSSYAGVLMVHRVKVGISEV
jgi:hypothetical protein